MNTHHHSEPSFPRSRSELDTYCRELVEAAQHYLDTHLHCVLLCGSWARDEANPPTSDVDVTIIVDQIDTEVLYQLRAMWAATPVGRANIYALNEVHVMSHEALEMYTTNARVLWGSNPFPLPTRHNFADDAARNAESVARYARILLLYPWLTPEEQCIQLTAVLADLTRLIQNMSAVRAGTFPKNRGDLKQRVAGTSEQQWLEWIDTYRSGTCEPNVVERAFAMDAYARACFRELAQFRGGRAYGWQTG